MAAVAGALVWLLALLLYVYTAGPGIVELFDDTLEFQYVAPTFGIAHPTGYPLYTLAGGLWSRVIFPFGNWAWRMNLFSALAAATAVLLTYLIAYRLGPQSSASLRIGSGFVAAAAFALGPVWWSQATVAEVYALHNLFVAAIVFTALTVPPLYGRGQPSTGRRAGSRRMIVLSFLIGLSLAHHRTTVLLLPALALYLLWSVPELWRPSKDWLLWLGALLIPLLLYLYIPLRASQGVSDLNSSYENSLQGFLDHVLARSYTGFLDINGPQAAMSVADSLRLVLTQLGAVASFLAIVGILITPFAGQARGKEWTLLTLVLVANFIFAIQYRVADQEVFFLPVFLVLSVFAGLGASYLVSLLKDRTSLVTAGAALLTILVIVDPFRADGVNRRNDWDAHQYAYLLGSVAYPEGSRVIGIEGEMTALKYVQAAEHMAVGTVPVTADNPVHRTDAVAENVRQGHPTYLTRELSGIESAYSFSSEGPVVRVWPRGRSDVDPLHNPVDAELLNGRLRLQGYELRTVDLPGGPVLELTLGWLPTEPLEHMIKVSLRPLRADGEPLLDESGDPLTEDRFPIRQVAPSTAWLPGELVRDVHYLSMRNLATPASVQVIVYDADTIAEYGRFELPVP